MLNLASIQLILLIVQQRPGKLNLNYLSPYKIQHDKQIREKYFVDMKQDLIDYVAKHCVFDTIEWKLERIIWIGYYKNDQNNHDNHQCLLAKLPKDVVLYMLMFLRL